MPSDEVGSTDQGQGRGRKQREAEEKGNHIKAMCLARCLSPPVRLQIVCFSLDSSLAEVGISQLAWEQAKERFLLLS